MPRSRRSMSSDGIEDEGDAFRTPASNESRPILPYKRGRDVSSSADDEPEDGPTVSSPPRLSPRRLDMDSADRTVLACSAPPRDADEDEERVETTQRYESEELEEGELPQSEQLEQGASPGKARRFTREWLDRRVDARDFPGVHSSYTREEALSLPSQAYCPPPDEGDASE